MKCCAGCGHPLAEGEWTGCDAECEHGGSVRLRDAYNVQRGWQEYDLDWIGMSAGAAQEDTVDVSGVQGHRYDCEARGRARAEERDCPECEGAGRKLIPRTRRTKALFAPCSTCNRSGRVRPMLCQACEGAET